MNTKDTGDIAESRIIFEFKRLGYAVLTPFGDNQPYDIMVDLGDNVLRVQVKSAWTDDGKVKFNTDRISQRNTNESQSYSENEIDGFAAYCSDLDECYWIDISDARKSRMRLRYKDSEIDHPSIVWSDDYLLPQSF